MKSFPQAARVPGKGFSCLLPQVGITFLFFTYDFRSLGVLHLSLTSHTFFFLERPFFFIALILFFLFIKAFPFCFFSFFLFLSDYYLLSALAIIYNFFFFPPFSFKQPMFDNRSFPRKKKKERKKQTITVFTTHFIS